MRGLSSAGQSACFTRRRSRVRAAQSPPKIPNAPAFGIFISSSLFTQHYLNLCNIIKLLKSLSFAIRSATV